MRSWLTYIFLSMVACGTVLTSCSEVLSEEGLGTCDDRTTVRLTISFGSDDDPMSRDVGSDPAPEDDDLDYTTKEQAEIVTGDVYALVVDATSNNFLYRIKDLHLEVPDTYDNYYTRTLEGTMIQTTQQVKIVLLANLVQNDIIIDGTALDSKEDVEAFIDKNEGKNVNVNTIYDQLIYNYNYNGTTTPWTLNARRIPMWGESQSTTVPPTKSIDLACYLYRAVAKVQIWVDKKNGIDGFVINSITVNNIHTKGYCVSQANFDDYSPNYDFNNDNIVDGVKPYLNPWIPTDPGTQNVTYADLSVRTYYSDHIYLPEQKNTDTDAVTITINYTYNEEPMVGTIEFMENGIGERFDVIRNHSYIFNINKIEEQTGKLYYYVTWKTEEVNIEFN